MHRPSGKNVTESKYFKMKCFKLDICLVRDAAIGYEVKYLRSVGYRTVIEIKDNLEELFKKCPSLAEIVLLVVKKK